MNEHKYLYISGTIIVVMLILAIVINSIVDKLGPEMTPPSPETLNNHRLSCDAVNRWQQVNVTKSSYTLNCVPK